MPNYDFACPSDHDFEVRCSIDARTDVHLCPECGEPGRRVILQAPHVCSVIVPMYPGSKAVSAGYTHSHGAKSATKTMSGPYGITQKKDLNPQLKAYLPDPKSSVKEAIRNGGKS